MTTASNYLINFIFNQNCFEWCKKNRKIELLFYIFLWLYTLYIINAISVCIVQGQQLLLLNLVTLVSIEEIHIDWLLSTILLIVWIYLYINTKNTSIEETYVEELMILLCCLKSESRSEFVKILRNHPIIEWYIGPK